MAVPTVLDEIERLFDELIHRPWGAVGRSLVPVEIRPVDDGWIVEFAVEGLRAHDLKIEVHGRQLIVKGHRQQDEQRKGAEGWTRTQQSHSLQRTIMLPAVVSPDDVEATVVGGLLSIHVRRAKR
ncbi:MAG TPA: Hsp20/alpha crystallin family protein [Candidatus Binatia bacterium]|nr:Hsp20/alpha crystallin family protein [Candidatus Binatia bacterium]